MPPLRWAVAPSAGATWGVFQLPCLSVVCPFRDHREDPGPHHASGEPPTMGAGRQARASPAGSGVSQQVIISVSGASPHGRRGRDWAGEEIRGMSTCSPATPASQGTHVMRTSPQGLSGCRRGWRREMASSGEVHRQPDVEGTVRLGAVSGGSRGSVGGTRSQRRPAASHSQSPAALRARAFSPSRAWGAPRVRCALPTRQRETLLQCVTHIYPQGLGGSRFPNWADTRVSGV